MQTITINKTQTTREVDFNSLPETSREFIINYGLRQILNDCHSSVQRKDFETSDEGQTAFIEAVDNAVKLKLEALKSGEVTARTRGTKKPTDPVEKIAWRMAREVVKAKLAEKDFTITAIGREKFNQLVSEYMEAAGAELYKKAKAEHKRVNDASADFNINLDELI